MCPRPDAVVMAAALEAGRDAAVPDRRRARGGGAGLRHRDGAARRQDRRARQPRTWPPRRPSCRPTAPSTSTPGRREIVDRRRQRPPAWIAADLIAQAEHDPDARAILLTTQPALRRAGGPRGRAQRPGRGPAAAALARARRHRRRRIADGGDGARRTASRPSTWCATTPATCGEDHARRARSSSAGTTAQAAGDYATGSNHVLPTAGAARFRGGLSAADFVRVIAVQEMRPPALAAPRADGHDAGAGRRAGGARAVGRGRTGNVRRTSRGDRRPVANRHERR